MSTTPSGRHTARTGPDDPGIPFPVPSPLFDDPVAEQRWRGRVRAGRMSVPRDARDRPGHSVYRSNAGGASQIYEWDRDTDQHRQVTDRPGGTVDSAITPDGAWTWWFADTNGDEFGHWMREPFGGGPAEPALAVPDGYASGIALGSTVVAVGLADDEGASTWISRQGGPAERIYHHPEDALLKALSRDETLVAINHSEHGDSRNPGIRVLHTATGDSAAEHRDPGRSLTPIEFAPIPGDNRLLVVHERRGRAELMLWDVLGGEQRELEVDVPGELTATFYPDASALLVRQTHAGRNQLYRLDLASGALTLLPTARGCIDDALVRGDGTIEYSRSSAAEPWAIRRQGPDGSDDLLVTPGGDPIARSVELTEHWVDGPGGPIHVFIAGPDRRTDSEDVPPAVVRLHGGPHMADEDSWNSMRAAWVDAGFTVIQPNYRGSSGYGADWRNAITGQPGLTELADVDAVRTWSARTGLIDPTRCVVEGYSWGGYLALLAAGSQPDTWAAAISGLPIADYIAAYDEEMESLRAMDRALFGGTPTDRPEAYRAASPLTYVADVRAPVLVMASQNDPRCPPQQIANYLRALDEHGRPAHVVQYEAGHGAHVARTVEDLTAAAISFARRVLSE